MASTKEIQRRIKSVNNTKKITKAMEMVAAAKMRRAVEAVLRTRTYANLSWTTILNITKSVGGVRNLHPLLTSVDEKAKEKVAIVVFASNRGLCGAFNTAVINKVHESIQKHHIKDGKKKVEVDIIAVGKRALLAKQRYNYNVIAEFPKLDVVSEVTEVSAISRMVIDDFLAKKYDKIMVAYTDYISASKQAPRVKQLLPVDVTKEDEYLGIVGRDSRIGLDKDYVKTKEDKYLKDKKKEDSYLFTFEPNASEVLDEMVPRLIEVQLFQALLESNASEHSARMAAMHKATDAANDLVDELVLYYNKARQASITSEIAEIAAGAEALNN